MPCHVAAWLPARNPRCPLRPASHVSTRPTYYIFFFMSCYFISIPFISFPFLLLYLLSFLACYYQCFCFLGLTLYLMSSSLLWNTHSRASSSPEACASRGRRCQTLSPGLGVMYMYVYIYIYIWYVYVYVYMYVYISLSLYIYICNRIVCYVIV